MRRWGLPFTLAWAVVLAACSGNQTTLNPAADQAAQSDMVWRTMLVVCGFMYLLVMAFLAWALARARKARGQEPAPCHTAAESVLERGLTGWGMLIILGLAVLTTVSFLADRSLARAAPKPLKVTVTANQWWWDVTYEGADPSQQISTANELHLPLGRQARLELHANDVIHSFWVPNLSGKEDLIPGRTNFLTLTPRRTGEFRGQCAEFCGLEHAKMGLKVMVDQPDQFEAWRAAQLASPPPPSTAPAFQGQQVFLSKGCALCHKIAGTDAGGRTGPDLSHLASRTTIAAGTLPNTRGALAGWIADPQGNKPGTAMPRITLTSAELNGLVDYLETLK